MSDRKHEIILDVMNNHPLHSVNYGRGSNGERKSPGLWSFVRFFEMQFILFYC